MGGEASRLSSPRLVSGFFVLHPPFWALRTDDSFRVCLSIFFCGLPRVAPRHVASLPAYLELEFGLYQLDNVGPGARLVDVDRLIGLAAADEAGALQVLRAGGGGDSCCCCCGLWRHSGHGLCLIIGRHNNTLFFFFFSLFIPLTSRARQTSNSTATRRGRDAYEVVGFACRTAHTSFALHAQISNVAAVDAQRDACLALWQREPSVSRVSLRLGSAWFGFVSVPSAVIIVASFCCCCAGCLRLPRLPVPSCPLFCCSCCLLSPSCTLSRSLSLALLVAALIVIAPARTLSEIMQEYLCGLWRR